jgi:hypothetical protein
MRDDGDISQVHCLSFGGMFGREVYRICQKGQTERTRQGAAMLFFLHCGAQRGPSVRA